MRTLTTPPAECLDAFSRVKLVVDEPRKLARLREEPGLYARAVSLPDEEACLRAA